MRSSRLQFGLRLLLALFTVAAVMAAVVAYHLRWMGQRRDFLARDDVMGVVIGEEPRAPALLGLFEERGVACVFVDDGALERLARRLFPEARILTMPPDTPI